MQRGCNTVVYRAVGFAESKNVTAYIFDPDMVKSPLLIFEPDGSGLYHIKYHFTVVGKYTMVVMENGQPKKSEFIFITV
jgi:hypothetical protein